MVSWLFLAASSAKSLERHRNATRPSFAWKSFVPHISLKSFAEVLFGKLANPEIHPETIILVCRTKSRMNGEVLCTAPPPPPEILDEKP